MEGQPTVATDSGAHNPRYPPTTDKGGPLTPNRGAATKYWGEA